MRGLICLIAVTSLVARVFAGGNLTTSVSTNRLLKIEPSSMKISGGKATLLIGTLKRTNDIYRGDFQMKVSPWFFKNEKGKLAITVTDQSIAKASQGFPVEISGTATTDGKSSAIRSISAVATPLDPDHGGLKLWFTVDERKMFFETDYRFIAE